VQHPSLYYRDYLNGGNGMGDISTHFSRHEFACSGPNCCGRSSPVEMRLIDALEESAATKPLSMWRYVGMGRVAGLDDCGV